MRYKVKRAIVAMALAFSMATSPVACLPMNVFAGGGKTGGEVSPAAYTVKKIGKGDAIASDVTVKKSISLSGDSVLADGKATNSGIILAEDKDGKPELIIVMPEKALSSLYAQLVSELQDLGLTEQEFIELVGGGQENGEGGSGSSFDSSVIKGVLAAILSQIQAIEAGQPISGDAFLGLTTAAANSLADIYEEQVKKNPTSEDYKSKLDACRQTIAALKDISESIRSDTIYGGTSTEITAVTGISIQSDTDTMNINGETQLKATVSPENATNKTVIWTSCNKSVATVDSTGKVKAVGAGTVAIMAQAGDKIAICEIKVEVPEEQKVSATGITISGAPSVITKDGEVELKAKVVPDNTTDKTVKWSSDNKDVAIVYATGQLKAVKGGTAKIKAKVGDKEAVCDVKVAINVVIDATFTHGENTFAGILAGTLTVNEAGDVTLTVDKGDTFDFFLGSANRVNLSIVSDTPHSYTTLTGKVTANAADKINLSGKLYCDLTGALSGRALLSFSGDISLNVTFNENGTVTINNGLVKSVSISGLPNLICKGETVKLTAIIEPKDVPNAVVRWRSSRPDCLKIDENTGQIENVMNNGYSDNKIQDIKITAFVDGAKSSVDITAVNPKTWLLLAEQVANAAYNIFSENKESNALWKACQDAQAAYNANQTYATAFAQDNANAKFLISYYAAGSIYNAFVTAFNSEYTEAINYLNKVLKSAGAKEMVTAQSSDGTEVDVVRNALNLSETDMRALCDAIESVKNCDVNDAKNCSETDLRVAYCVFKVAKTLLEKAGDTASDKYVEGVGLSDELKELIDKYFSQSSVIFAVDNIEIQNIPNSNMNSGEKQQLSLKITPKEAANKTPIWSSSDTNIAFVDHTGMITAIGSGTATITAGVEDKTDICMVEVKVPVESVVINRINTFGEAEIFGIIKGKKKLLVATIMPPGAVETAVLKWSSSDESIATVDEDTGEVMALKLGFVEIQVEVNGKKDSIRFLVVEDVSNINMFINEYTPFISSGTEYSINTYQFKYKVESEQSDVVIASGWVSGNPDIAIVDDNGVVIGKSPGLAGINLSVLVETNTRKQLDDAVYVFVDIEDYLFYDLIKPQLSKMASIRGAYNNYSEYMHFLIEDIWQDIVVAQKRESVSNIVNNINTSSLYTENKKPLCQITGWSELATALNEFKNDKDMDDLDLRKIKSIIIGYKTFKAYFSGVTGYDSSSEIACANARINKFQRFYKNVKDRIDKIN